MNATTPYKTLVYLAKSLVGTEIFSVLDGPSASAIRGYVSANATILSTVRTALGPQCRVPLEDEASFYEEHVKDVLLLRNLARSFDLQMTQMKSDGNLTELLRIGVDLLDLASCVRRGGLVIDLQVSNTMAALSLDHLRSVRAECDTRQRLVLIEELARVDVDQEPFSEVDERDRRWEKAVGIKNEVYCRIVLEFIKTEPDGRVANAMRKAIEYKPDASGGGPANNRC